jgi:cytoskeletal protein RodZ
MRRWHVAIGGALAAARTKAGLTVTQVSERTRIRERIILGIERDDYAACGGDFYARGHIRAIARVIGIDPAPLIAEYDAVLAQPVDAL